MTELKARIEDTLSLVEQNFEFLHVGMFFDEYAKSNDLSSNVKLIELTLDDGSKKYRLAPELTKKSLHEYFKKGGATVFGYMVAWNAFRGIGMAMKEGMQDKSPFKDFVEKKLGIRYGHYDAILSFIRNILSHNIHNEIQLKKGDYDRTCAEFNKKYPSGIATLSINYADVFPGTNSPSDYGFSFEVDFNSLKPGTRFLDVVSEWHLYMFSELCFNLVKEFRKEV